MTNATHNCTDCPVTAGTHKPADAVHTEIAEPSTNAQTLAQRLDENADIDAAEGGNPQVRQLERDAARMLRTQDAELSTLRARCAELEEDNAETARVLGAIHKNEIHGTWIPLVEELRARIAELEAKAQGVPWPKDAKDVRDFFNADFISAQFPADGQVPCDEDRYTITAHDFLSAVNWWADFPHVPRSIPAAPSPAVPAEPGYIEGGRESADDALAVMESFGSNIEGMNDEFARQIILAAEVRRLQNLYKSSVRGRNAFRNAYRKLRAAIFPPIGCPACGITHDAKDCPHDAELAAHPAEAVPAAAPDARDAALTEILGCLDAANSEGLDDALVNNTDPRLTDLVQRRLLPAFYAAIAAQAKGGKHERPNVFHADAGAGGSSSCEHLRTRNAERPKRLQQALRLLRRQTVQQLSASHRYRSPGRQGAGMSMEYIRNAYNVPAKRGARVEYTGEISPTVGTITGTEGARLRIRMDGETYTGIYHPTWELRYLPAERAQADQKGGA